MRRALLVITVVVVLAGCTGPLGGEDTETYDDGIGVVDGVQHNSSVAVTVDDGLNETEIDRVATRSMARIEVIRGLNFEERTDIRVMTREEYREWRGDGNVSTVRRQWENTVWEAAFIVGQDRDVLSVFDQTLGTAVQGFYAPSEEEIVIITDGEDATISTETLVHELVHALQDQQFGLPTVPERLDGEIARDSVIEGEAELIPKRYFDRCGGEWSCVDMSVSAGGQGERNPGLTLVLLTPYQQGLSFVESVQAEGGWEAVDDLYENLPASAAQVIDPERYPDSKPVDVTVQDTAGDAWHRLDHEPVGETMGQAGLYAMFWHNGVIEVEDTYSYTHPAVDGWAGDELVPYTNEDNETGYVWEIEWESVDDAREFSETYHDLLRERGARERGQRAFVIPEGPFQGAFEVTQQGTTVRIVKGPTLETLDEIHG
jgi:hypothetical protein